MRKINLFLLLLPVFIISSCTSDKNTRPNILFIMADDFRPEINAYGIERALTPNFDRLASQGVLFRRAYAQQAICAASRASVFSGMRPDVAGCDYPYSEYYVNELVQKHPTLFKYFYNNGYHLETMGKLHHDPYLDDIPVEHRFFRTEEYYDSVNQRIYNSTPGRRNNKVIKLPPFELADLPDSVYDDYQMAKAAADFLKNYKNSKEDKPFFLAVGFWKPHAPYVAPAKYAEPFSLDDIKMAPNPENTSGVEFSIPGHATLDRYKRENDTIHGHACTEQRAKEVIRAYLACTYFNDHLIGNIMNALEESGLSDNTIIVFTSDHGYHLGNHGSWGKTTNYECATKTPLIVVDPRIKEKGVKCNSLVELVDIYPSLVEMAGLEVPDFLEGTSFNSLINNFDREWKSAAFSQYPRSNEIEGYSVRMDNYRYTEWRSKDSVKVGDVIARELYDEVNDPLEMNNLADKKDYDSIATIMKEKLKQGWKHALPKDITNSSNNPLAPYPVRWHSENVLVDKSGDYQTKK